MYTSAAQATIARIEDIFGTLQYWKEQVTALESQGGNEERLREAKRQLLHFSDIAKQINRGDTAELRHFDYQKEVDFRDAVTEWTRRKLEIYEAVRAMPWRGAPSGHTNGTGSGRYGRARSLPVAHRRRPVSGARSKYKRRSPSTWRCARSAEQQPRRGKYTCTDAERRSSAGTGAAARTAYPPSRCLQLLDLPVRQNAIALLGTDKRAINASGDNATAVRAFRSDDAVHVIL